MRQVTAPRRISNKLDRVVQVLMYLADRMISNAESNRMMTKVNRGNGICAQLDKNWCFCQTSGMD